MLDFRLEHVPWVGRVACRSRSEPGPSTRGPGFFYAVIDRGLPSKFIVSEYPRKCLRFRGSGFETVDMNPASDSRLTCCCIQRTEYPQYCDISRGFVHATRSSCSDREYSSISVSRSPGSNVSWRDRIAVGKRPVARIRAHYLRIVIRANLPSAQKKKPRGGPCGCRAAPMVGRGAPSIGDTSQGESTAGSRA